MDVFVTQCRWIYFDRSDFQTLHTSSQSDLEFHYQHFDLYKYR